MQDVLPVPGAIVWIRRQRWRVERATRDGNVVRLDVGWQRKRRTFLAPFDQVLAGQKAERQRVRPQEALARLASTLARTPDHRLPLSLIDANVHVLPHQIEPALALINGHTRLLIADEVGLGKTIQAGLAIAELVRRQPSPRVLVLVPASLRDQWQAELRTRFDLECLRADRRHLDAMSLEGAFGTNPWERSGVWLASADFLKQKSVLGSLPSDTWDLIVVDEAHAVCGDTDRYSACHALAARSRRVLLLTATPHSGDDARFARLAALGSHHDGNDPPLIFRRTRTGLGLPNHRRVRWNLVGLRDAESKALAELEKFERVALGAAPSSGGDGARLLLAVFRKRALSTFTALSRSLSRRLLWLGEDEASANTGWTQPRLVFDEESDDEATSELAGLTVSLGLDPQQERCWLRRLLQLADDAARHESKIARLQSILERSTEPVVVFSEFRDSLDAIETRLRRNRSMALLHGGQDPAEQREQLHRYLAGPATVLLATDVAGQGLNLQSRGRWVISLELPWNPARLEQRVGRVDRLGQTRTPHLTLLVARHEAERGLLSHLARRVLGARRAFSDDVLRDFAPPEAAVRSALLATGDRSEAMPSVSEAKQAPLNLSRRWKRAGAVVAESLSRRRRLARRWRCASSETNQIICARLEKRAPSSIVVCSVPVLNEDDELVERCVVALTMPTTSAAQRPREVNDQIRPLVIDQLRRRTAKLAFSLSRAAALLVCREEGIVAHARAWRAPAESQPGLFDARELRTQLAQTAKTERLESQSRQRIASLGRTSQLRHGEIELEFVLDCGK